MLRVLLCGFIFMASVSIPSQDSFASDLFSTASGELKITFMFSNSDPTRLIELLKPDAAIDVRVRKMN